MDNLPIIISVLSFVLLVLGFIINRYENVKKAGANEEKLNNSIKEIKTELDNRIKSVCDKHDSDIKTEELKMTYLSQQLHEHISDNEKEHTDLFRRMDIMATDISEIKTGVAVLVAAQKEGKK